MPPPTQQAVGQLAARLSDILRYVAPLSIDAQVAAAVPTNVLGLPVQVDASADAADAIARAYNALKQGQLETLVARSPAALGMMLPVLFQLSRAMLPAVVHVLARGHSDLMLVRDAGVAILAPVRAEEAKDFAVIAHVAALRSHVPFLHVLDNDVAVAAATEGIDSPATAQLQQWIGFQDQDVDAFRQRVIEDASKSALGAELYFQEGPERAARFEQVPSIVQDVVNEAFPSQHYGLVEYVGDAHAENVVVALGSTAAAFQVAVEAQSSGVGVVLVRLFRPWPTQEFLKVVPRSVRRVAVIDRLEQASELGAPLFLSVAESFNDNAWQERPLPDVLSVTLAAAGPDATGVVSASTASKLVEQLIAGSLARGVFPQDDAFATITEPSACAADETTDVSAGYSTMLQQLFGHRAVIANLLHSATVWHEGDATTSLDTARLESSEFGLGVHLALLAKRKQLKSSVLAWLADQEQGAASPKTRLVECLKQWTTIATPSDALVDEISKLVETEARADATLSEISNLRRYFARPSQWILGSEAFSRDIGASGVHQVLASGENVNLLILDTEPMAAVSKNQRKRDIGLYAMQYGNAYVASVALHDSSSLVLRALSEADAFEGPSIVLAYAPACENPEEETKQAINSSYWPLYRYNPLLEEVDGEHAFALESATIKKEFAAFLERNNQLSIFAKESTAPLAEGLTPSLTTSYEKLGSTALQSSFDALLHGLNAQQEEPWQRDIKLTILVGSDNGHAEDIATRFQEEALRLGLRDVAKSDMNDAGVDGLQDVASNEHGVVLFVCATAGQGEFPANAKTLWEQLANYAAELPVQYAVFGMGDSNYWTREDEKHYFCRAPRDLDRKLSEIGAKRVTEMAVADDQDEDGPSTRYEAWKSSFWEHLGIPAEAIARAEGAAPKQRTNEEIKLQSNFLRGTIAQSLDDRSTTAIPADDTQLTKFHGIYMQDNRDARQNDDGKVHTFMIRVRVPGGVSTTEQYLLIDKLADECANGNIKITTRQTYQLQGILKWNLRATVQGLNRVLMDSLAACGDVNRNVMASSTPACSSEVYQEILDSARNISAHLLPRTGAYHEIWLDRKQVAGGAIPDVEPYYGNAYLPRKFKIALAIPPSNDVDVFANCLGFIAIVEDNHLVGFNVSVGGGMGMTHNNHKTFPRLADMLGFCTPEQAQDVAEKVLIQQRDLGDRKNRRHARYKYTVEDHGLEWIRADLERRLGYTLEKPRAFKFDSHTDRLGWHKMDTGKFFYTLFLEGGRIKDTPELKIRTGLRTLAQKFPNVEFHLTPNQNLSVVHVEPEQVAGISALLQEFHFGNDQHSAMRLSSIACAALPFCPLAFAEGERYLPTLVSQLEEVLEENGLTQDAIVIRMTGCANGCARAYIGEIGLVGRAPGIYNLYLGASYNGDRLNKLYKQDVATEAIKDELAPIIRDYAGNRNEGERFGDFVIRRKYVEACRSGPFFEDRAPADSFHA